MIFKRRLKTNYPIRKGNPPARTGIQLKLALAPTVGAPCTRKLLGPGLGPGSWPGSQPGFGLSGVLALQLNLAFGFGTGPRRCIRPVRLSILRFGPFGKFGCDFRCKFPIPYTINIQR